MDLLAGLQDAAATDVPVLFSPAGIVLWYVWSFAVLASIQLTVRLIRAFSIKTTAIGALAYLAGSLPIAFLYWAILESSLAWYPLPMLLSGLLGFVVAHYALRLRRLRGRIAAAVGTAILSGPWPLFFELLPPLG